VQHFRHFSVKAGDATRCVDNENTEWGAVAQKTIALFGRHQYRLRPLAPFFGCANLTAQFLNFGLKLFR
jgi:hypothetical protein